MTTAPTKRPPWPARLLLAPLHLLERSRGRWRLALVFLYLIALAVGLLLAWRALSLANLPDLDDPFDPAEFDARVVPDEENAFTYYRQAGAALKLAGPEHGLDRLSNWYEAPWSQAEPGARRRVEENGEALRLWLRGSRLDEALLVDPRRRHIGTILEPAQELREFARLGRLEASRRLEAGDAAGAWEVLLGVLRASRHLGRGGGRIERIIGTAVARVAGAGVRQWLADPRVGDDDLRRALADLRAARALQAPASEMVKVEYLEARNTLVGPDAWNDPDAFRRDEPHVAYFLPGGFEATVWLRREPERSLRVVRIVFDAWLAQADRPPSQRAPPFVRAYEFYPPAPRVGMRPEVLADWLDSTLVARHVLSPVGNIQGVVDGDLRALSALESELAHELFRREHGREPDSIAELIGPYLDRLPDAYEGLDTPD